MNVREDVYEQIIEILKDAKKVADLLVERAEL
jgi:hypothetical protein